MTPTLKDVEKLADDLMGRLFEFRDYNDNLVWRSAKELGYTFRWDNAKRRFGVCSRTKKIIGLSKPLCSLNLDKLDTQIRDVILHEIAHAFAYDLYGKVAWNHGYLWKHTAEAVGADPNTYYDSDAVETVAAKYTVYCTEGHEHSRHRLPKSALMTSDTKGVMTGRSCSKCCGYYNPAHQLYIKKNF